MMRYNRDGDATPLVACLVIVGLAVLAWVVMVVLVKAVM